MVDILREKVALARFLKRWAWEMCCITSAVPEARIQADEFQEKEKQTLLFNAWNRICAKGERYCNQLQRLNPKK